MEEENTSPNIFLISCKKKAYIDNFHVDTLHNKMELLSKKKRHIAEVAQALMVAEKNMPYHLWEKEVNTSVYIMNTNPTIAIHEVTLEEKYSGKKPNLSHMKVFGYIAYVHVPNELQTKLDPNAKKCVFVGYSHEQKDIDVTIPHMM